ncbi:MAG: hypothetical protein KDD62_10570, partial [Bdellovibrionales bacterium]|nr:hypothetical protein [Bdellovibrionales bacterium]
LLRTVASETVTCEPQTKCQVTDQAESLDKLRTLLERTNKQFLNSSKDTNKQTKTNDEASATDRVAKYLDEAESLINSIPRLQHQCN